jgi:hypothetical protein
VLSRLLRERAAAEASVADLEEQVAAARAQAIERAAVEAHLRELRGQLLTLDPEERRRALVAFAVRVEGDGQRWTGWGRLGPAGVGGVLFTTPSSRLHNALAFTWASDAIAAD